ncbi:MAG: thioredoxin family protein [Tateyamaria sp.]|jgi:thiol-disulfide isomerase/thioredoxin|uniref:thioredoxin family protein n=1 Tax=Tateyamaria sp. TaxID=1929288 RepID=UPI0032DDE1AE
MDRRTFLISAAAATAVPFAVQAAGFVDYTPGAIDAALAEGKTVFVDFSATWCSTCKRQERVINALRAENPDYDSKLTFIKVDWDTYKSADVTTSRNIPRRSTLLLLRGDDELGRVIAGTSESQIKALMDIGL